MPGLPRRALPFGHVGRPHAGPLIRSAAPFASLVFLLAALLSLPGAAAGQSGVDLDAPFGLRTALGWAGSLPDAILGAGGLQMMGDGRWGWFAEVKIPHDSKRRNPDFRSDLTVARVLEEFEPNARIAVGRYEEWRLLNLSLVRALSSESAVYVGGGIARKSLLQEFGDNTDPPLTRTGFYFVEDTDESGWHPNFVAGVILRGGERVGFSTGFETITRTITLGILLVIR